MSFYVILSGCDLTDIEGLDVEVYISENKAVDRVEEIFNQASLRRTEFDREKIIQTLNSLEEEITIKGVVAGGTELLIVSIRKINKIEN